MRSKTWSCKISLPLFRKAVTRYWPVWVSYFAIWALLLPIPLLNAFADIDLLTGELNRMIVNTGESPAVIMSLLYGGLAAFAVWSHLYRQNSASMYHALPVTRETHFLSHFLAGYSFLLVPNCLIALLTYLCQLSLGAPDPTLLLQWLAIVSLEGLLFYAIGTLAAMLTGSLVTMPVLYGLFNLAAWVCEALVVEFSTSLYYGVHSMEHRLTALSPVVHLLENEPGMYITQPFTEVGTIAYAYDLHVFDPDFFRLLGWYTLAAAAMLICALLLYRRHATETAGDVISVPWLRPVAKYAFSIGCALCLGWVFEQVLFSRSTNIITIFLSCALGGIIGYLAALMLLQKSFRVFKPRLLAGLLPVLAALGLWLGGVQTDLFGVEAYIPDPEDIKKVTVYADYDIDFTDPEDFAQVIELHQATLALGELLPMDVDARYRLTYVLHNGRKISRRYDIPTDMTALSTPGTPANLLSAIVNKPQRLVEQYLPPAYARLESGHVDVFNGDLLLNDQHEPQLKPDELEQMRKAIRRDLLDLKTGTWQSDWRKEQQLQFRVTLQCAVPLDDQDTATWTAPTAEAEDGYSYRWYDISYYDDCRDTAAYQLLCKLGYLK